jgi:hypothetical protein
VRERVAQAGYVRCVKSKYAYIHRLKTALDVLSRI